MVEFSSPLPVHERIKVSKSSLKPRFAYFREMGCNEKRANREFGRFGLDKVMRIACCGTLRKKIQYLQEKMNILLVLVAYLQTSLISFGPQVTEAYMRALPTDPPKRTEKGFSPSGVLALTQLVYTPLSLPFFIRGATFILYLVPGRRLVKLC